MTDTQNAQEHIHESDGSTANPSKLICRRCGETYSYDTNVANSLKTSGTQNDTSELDAQLDEILAAHWQVSRAELKEPLAALIAQREQAARIDELRDLVGYEDDDWTGFLQIPNKKVIDRIKELQATKPEKGTL